MTGPAFVLGTVPVFLSFDGLGFVLFVLRGWCDHPFGLREAGFLVSVVVLSVLVFEVGSEFPFAIGKLFDLRLESKDFFFF